MAIVKRRKNSSQYIEGRALDGGIQSAEDLHRIAAENGIRTEPFDTEAFIYYLGIDLVIEPMPNHQSGCLINQNGTWQIRINSLHHPRRRRFTMAHEIAHYFLHRHQQEQFVDQTLFRSEEEADPIETQANRFAGELLMPEELIRERMRAGGNKVEDLARYFDVSSLAMRVRAKQIGLSGHGL